MMIAEAAMMLHIAMCIFISSPALLLLAIFMVVIVIRTSNRRSRGMLPHDRSCPACGSVHPPHAAYCAHCGHSLD